MQPDADEYAALGGGGGGAGMLPPGAYDAPGGGGGYDGGAGAGASAPLVRGQTLDPSAAAAPIDSGPLLAMEEILEKLKMLDYEDHFKAFRPLTHTYFAMPSANPNEQFYYFTSLVSWLLTLLGQSWKAPSQLDDPNSAVASLYSMLQQIGAPTNFGAQKLKSGCGEAVCAVLKHLLDLIPIEFRLPVYKEENAYEEAAVDEDAEIEAEEMADEVGAADVEEEEMYYHGGGDAAQARAGGSGRGGAASPGRTPRVPPRPRLSSLEGGGSWGWGSGRRAGGGVCGGAHGNHSSRAPISDGRAGQTDRLDPRRVGRAGGVAARAGARDPAAQNAGKAGAPPRRIPTPPSRRAAAASPRRRR